MIAIRVDANEHIASGHAIRCLSIADALFYGGEDVVFFTSDRLAKEMIKKRGFRAVLLDFAWDDKESELDDLINKLNNEKPDMLLIDSYQVTPHYLESLNEQFKTAYIDDVNAFDYTVDIVINYAIYSNDLDYPANKSYILGTDYVPLRKQFDVSDDILENAAKSRKNGLARQILVTTGAADPFHIGKQVVSEILSESCLSEYRIVLIKGRFSEDPGLVNERVSIFENVENMADIMLSSAMAVSAGGSTLYELCACCVPTITFSYADNQIENVNGFAKRGIMPYSGNIEKDNDVIESIMMNLLDFHYNRETITEIMGRMFSLNIRGGATRLAKELIKRAKPEQAKD